MRGRSWTVATAVSVAAMMAAAPAFAQQQIRPGAPASGALGGGDSRLDSGEYVDTYQFRGRAGQRVTVRMSSSEVDSYVMVRGPAGFSEFNDDGPDGGTDAALTVRLPADGEYRILATSYQPGESGRYRLTLDDGGQAPGGYGGGGGGGFTQSLGQGGGAQPPQQPPRRPDAGGPNSGGGQIRVNASNAGRLAQGDEALDSGEFTDRWTLRGTAGRRYVATLSATDFDPYLMVRGDNLSEDNDDDPSGRGSRNSRIDFIMPPDGEVQVVATSYAARETGGYDLIVEEIGGGGTSGPARPGPERPGPSSPRPTDHADGAIAPGQTVNGRLQEGSSQLRSGEFADGYALRGRRGDRLDLRLSSTEFDPYLFITGPGDFTAANDDAEGGGTDSRLIVTLPADGEYRVVATSYEAGERGRYRLIAQAASAQTVEEARPTPPAATDVGLNERGALTAGDATLSDGEHYDVFTFRGRRGERIAATLSSPDFDAYLILGGPGEEQEDNDDGPDMGTDSRIDTVLQADGEYTLTVTSFRAGETGSYQLTVGPSLGSPRQQNVEGGQRVFGVMVGISEYGGAEDDLPYTAEDASKLAEALRREGVLNPASITLTDAQATVSGVRQAFARVAAQAGPDDLFVFFYSGHGNQIDGPTSASEPDGKTETLVLRDGELTDDELSDLFGTLRTRMSMVVLDSCFSGGFARNVVNRPGVVGLFSSEEDLTSQVAEKFEAGGYLSHFLRSGLSGAANLDGDDMITAGELSTYLRRQFAAEVNDVEAETQDGQRSYQNLVIDRGGVQVDDVVLRL